MRGAWSESSYGPDNVQSNEGTDDEMSYSLSQCGDPMMQLLDEPTSKPRSGANLLIFTAFCIGQAVQTNNGVIHPVALAWVGVAIVAALAAVTDIRVRAFGGLERLSTTKVLSACIAIQWAQTMLWALRWGPAGAEGWAGASLLVAGAGILLIARDQRTSLGIVLTFVGFALAAIGVVHASPGIGIDVFYFQEESTAALLSGSNPYGVRFRDIYYPQTGFYGADASVDGWLTYSYPYPPLMLLLVAPAKLLLGDLRYAHLAAMLVSVGLIVATRPGRVSMLAAALLLTLPRNLLTLQVAWTEPMVLMCLSFVVYAAMKRRPLLWLAIGSLLAVKQYSILFLPLIPVLLSNQDRRALRKACLLAACFAAATIVPFLLWSPTQFVRSVALWQFRQPFFEDALSYTTMVWRLTGLRLGAWPGFLAVGAATVLAWRYAPRSPSGFVGAATLAMLAFFAFNKQAFCNYYTLVAGMGCWAGALVVGEQDAAINEHREPPIQVIAVRRAA